jgi:uncharacterized membrane protein
MRSIRERVVHMVLFEIGAIAVVSPVVAWATGTPLAEAGVISLGLALIATSCNFAWTLAFDRLVPTRRRGFRLRALQAIGLEIVIGLFAIPVFYFAAHATLTQALLLDLGGSGFFIIYAMIYNWTFDRVMLSLGAAG